jgi:hypothetical protein
MKLRIAKTKLENKTNSVENTKIISHLNSTNKSKIEEFMTTLETIEQIICLHYNTPIQHMVIQYITNEKAKFIKQDYSGFVELAEYLQKCGDNLDSTYTHIKPEEVLENSYKKGSLNYHLNKLVSIYEQIKLEKTPINKS